MNAPVARATRSGFVTVIGVIVLVLGVISALKALQLLVLILPGLRDVNTRPGTATAFLLYMGARLAIAAFFVYAAYALLNRRNWARITFIVFFWLCIAANVTFLAWFVLSRKDLFGPYSLGFGQLFAVFAVVAVGFLVLFAWFIKRLRAPAVQAEFGIVAPPKPEWWERKDQSRP